MKKKIRIVEMRINDFPSDEFKAQYSPVRDQFFSESIGYDPSPKTGCYQKFTSGQGWRILLSGEYDIHIDYMLNNLFTETAYIKLTHRDTLKTYHIRESAAIAESLSYHLGKHLDIFHSRQVKDGTIYHSQGGKYINEYPSQNKVRIAQNKNGKYKEEWIERDYSTPVTEDDWLAILQKSEGKGRAEVSEALAILNKSFKFDAIDCEISRFASKSLQPK